MSDSLYSLCKICKIDEPKYCCPRCSTRTCCIQCYQKHQKRSQCNGKRDPAAYVTAKELATPAGIDRDFNFLTSIERAFDTADRDKQEKGLAVPGNSRLSNEPRSSLSKALLEAGINVVRAPRGMKRQRDNSTDWDSRRKCIRWNVEWIYEDGSRRLSSSSETQTLRKAYNDLLIHEETKQAVPGANKSESRSKRVRRRRKEKAPGNSSEETKQAVLETTTGETDMVEPQELTPPISKHHADFGAANEETASIYDPSTAQVDFYLYRPQTSSASRVLIAIADPEATTLSSLLQNRTVLEFPTIYVFKKSSTLPSGFITEETYEKQRKKLVEEIEHDEQVNAVITQSAVKARLGSNGVSASSNSQDTKPYGDSKVMESLQRDLEWVSQFAE